MRFNRENAELQHELMGTWGPYDVIQGFYLGHVVFALHEHEVLKSLGKWQSPESLSRQFGLDEKLLNHLLTFLHLSTNLLARDRRGFYRLAPEYANFALLSFQIEKFLGAYGPPVASLTSVLRNPSLGEKLIDQKALANAFRALEPPTEPSPGAQIVTSLGIRVLVDLGCGPATLLNELATNDSGFRGWGLDKSDAMCRLARQRLRSSGSSRQVKIIRGDARYLTRYFGPRQRLSVEALYAGSLLNEWFRDGTHHCVRFLKRAKSLFPGRVLIVDDYFGRLNLKQPMITQSTRHNILHDLMQAVTGQGVPPSDSRGWRSVYREAGCRVLRTYEGVADGIAWFYHIIQL